MYPAIMPPEMCAIPLVITTISSDLVSLGRKGRIVSGASVWPMKMLAATLRDSAPLAPITRVMIHAEAVKNREERRNKDDRGKYLESERKTKTGELLWQTEVAENKCRPCIRKAQQLICARAKKAEHRTA